MLVKRYLLVALGVACMAGVGFTQKTSLPVGAGQKNSADWRPVAIDPVALAAKSDNVMKTFKGVDGAVSMRINLGPKVGHGGVLLTEQFSSAKVFKLHYPRFLKDTMNQEYLIANSGSYRRLGVKLPNTPVSSDFNVENDAAFVEIWPKAYGRMLFSPLMNGNATMTRFVKLLKKGVGGYTVRTDVRDTRTSSGVVRNYRIYASRPAKGKLPASSVEIILAAAAPYLPVNIHTIYGDFDAAWLCKWRNNQKFPADTFKMAVSPSAPAATARSR